MYMEIYQTRCTHTVALVSELTSPSPTSSLSLQASSVAMTSELKAKLSKREEKISQLEKTTASLEVGLGTCHGCHVNPPPLLCWCGVACLGAGQCGFSASRATGSQEEGGGGCDIIGSQGNCLPTLDTQLVSREAEFQVHSKALQVSGLLGIVMCTVGPLRKYLPSPFPSPLPAMFSDDHARHAT